MPELRIRSADVELRAKEDGDRTRPTIVFVHGYPDTGAVWDGVTARLSDRFHVVTYDIRGAGGSTEPDSPTGYRLERLVADLRAVIGAVSPDRPVHLVGHDWGAMQCWAALFAPETRDRIASFTCFGGASLEHFSTLMRQQARSGPAGALAVARQLAMSSYMAMMQIPYGPELLLRATGPQSFERVLRRQGIPPRPGHPAATLRQDLINGLALYRQNMFTDRGDAAELPGPTAVPLQLIVTTRDRYLRPEGALGHAALAKTVWLRRLATGHWAQLTRPSLLAEWIGEFVDAVESGPVESQESPPFEGHLAVVTGAGSGIGRATAEAFSRFGARVVVADVDEGGAKHTADGVAAKGGTAYVYQVDVADAEAMSRFADYVQQAFGVPDIVVNNAGIAIAGPLLETGEKDWSRITSINLDGVYRGCRLFARQMVARGEGGHLVNVASMAAYTPSAQLGAYSATKAAVLQLSECLRLELERHGIGVSAICPGVINTPIARHSQYVGVSQRTADDIRERAAKALRLRGYPPEKVASAIMNAVLRDRPVVPVTPEAYVGRAISRLSPGANRTISRLLSRLDRSTAGGTNR